MSTVTFLPREDCNAVLLLYSTVVYIPDLSGYEGHWFLFNLNVVVLVSARMMATGEISDDDLRYSSYIHPARDKRHFLGAHGQ